MIPYGHHILDEEDIEAVVEILRSESITQGTTGNEFSDSLSAYTGSRYCVAVSSGTAALHLIGLALSWGKSDVILTSPITFLASANSIVYSRATPDFIDIDKLIEKETNLKIYEIFQRKGESYFRNLEEKITLKLLKDKGKIIALGGGGFLNKNIRREILKSHISFWLSWKNSTIINRILKSKKRPIAISSSENDLKKLINERSNIYSEAKFKINCETLTKNMIVKNIIELYEKNKT